MDAEVRSSNFEPPFRCQDRCPSKKESEDEMSRAGLSPHTSYPGCYEVDWALCKCLPPSPFTTSLTPTNALTSCSRKMTRNSGRYNVHQYPYPSICPKIVLSIESESMTPWPLSFCQLEFRLRQPASWDGHSMKQWWRRLLGASRQSVR